MKIAFTTLCDLKKDEIKECRQEIERIVRHPRYLCLRCARVAHDPVYLCKARELSS